MRSNHLIADLVFQNIKMNLFDTLYFSVQKQYRPKHKHKANLFALWYVSLLQSGLLLFAGVLIAHFLEGMSTSGLSQDKAWLLFGMSVGFVFFRNWIMYSGRKQKIMLAKNRKKSSGDYKLWMLWLLLIGVFSLSILMLVAL